MIKLGLCGCGGFMERGVLPLMQRVDNVTFLAAYDEDPSRVELIGKRFGIKRSFNNYQDLIHCDELDAVYIASPNVFHKDQTVAAAKAGKHVFCQKPMALNAQDCRQMIDVCRAQGVKLGIGFCYPFAGAQTKTKDLLAEGAIGEVSCYTVSFSLGGYNKNTVGWRCDPQLSGGGPLMDIAPHLINLGCFFLDDQVHSVMAYVRPERTLDEIELDAAAVLEFSRGARGFIDTSFVRSHLHCYSLIGTRGRIYAEGTLGWRAAGKIILQTGSEVREIPFQKTEGIEQEIRLFGEAIERDEQPAMPGEAGLHTQAVIDAIYRSGKCGKRCLLGENT